MSDAEIRERLLRHFYKLRHNNGGWVPLSGAIMSPDVVTMEVLGGVCEQLSDVGLINWKPLRTGLGLVAGNAKITGQGVSVVEGIQAPNIDLGHIGRKGQPQTATKDTPAIRDKKLLRELLKLIAANSKPGVSSHYAGTDDKLAVEGFSIGQINQHLEMLLQMGLVNRSGSQPTTGITVKGVSPQGYDFLEEASEGDPAAKDEKMKARKVFLVHGHDDQARENVKRFLQQADFEVIILHEQARCLVPE